MSDLESVKHNPVASVKWVPLEEVEANDYNPNSVATNEMKLLYLSIKSDGYTQPVVTYYDEKKKKYVIVDGFHRYSTMRNNKDIYDLNKGLLPLVVIEKDINDRMASTVRHNRARGKHSVTGMSSMVFEMLHSGMSETEVMNNLGMEADEVRRLKHITGFSKLFDKVEYTNAYMTEQQVLLRKRHKEKKSEDKK